MIECKVAIAAATAITDIRSNQISFIQILEDMEVMSFPAVLSTVSMVFILGRSAEDPNTSPARLTVNCGGSVILEQPVTIEFGDNLRNRLTFDMSGLPLIAPGKLSFSLADATGRQIGSYELMVTSKINVVTKSDHKTPTIIQS